MTALAAEAAHGLRRPEQKSSTPPLLDAVLLAPPAPYHRRSLWPASVRSVSVALLATGITVAAFTPDYPAIAEAVTLNASALLLALGFLASDLSRVHKGGISAISAFSAVAAATALANIVGLLEADGALRDLYFGYTAEDYLALAAQLQWAFTVFPVLGFWMVTRNRALKSLCSFIPEIRSTVSVRAYLVTVTIASVIVIFLNLGERNPFSGEATRVLVMLPNLAVFTLARFGAERNDRVALRVAVFVALLEASRALMYGYIRAGIATPLFAYICGVTLGARSLRPLLRRSALPILVSALVFVRFYGLLGESREWYLQGPEKLGRMWTYQSTRDDKYWLPPQQTVLARLTSFNQLSQIGRVVERDGHYRGKTFEYLRYAFIPRFLWREKPRIALGAWYAVTIGQGVPMEDGWFNNSVNMTQAGELYLNFGWPAVPIGLLLYGFLLGVFWTRTRFWESDSRNVLGGAFALYLIWMVLGAHGEFTVFVSLVAVYLLLLALSWALQAPAIVTSLRRTLGLTPALQLVIARAPQWQARVLRVRLDVAAHPPTRPTPPGTGAPAARSWETA